MLLVASDLLLATVADYWHSQGPSLGASLIRERLGEEACVEPRNRAGCHHTLHRNRYASKLDESAGMAGIPGVRLPDQRGAAASDPLGAPQAGESEAHLCPVWAAGAPDSRWV